MSILHCHLAALARVSTVVKINFNPPRAEIGTSVVRSWSPNLVLKKPE
jgi:hypothetical protein